MRVRVTWSDRHATCFNVDDGVCVVSEDVVGRYHVDVLVCLLAPSLSFSSSSSSSSSGLAFYFTIQQLQ